MNRFIFNGSTLARKEIYGVQRNTMELLKEMDFLVEKNQIELVVPMETERRLDFSNIRVTHYQGLHDNSKSVRLWNMFGFSNYVRKNNGVGVDMILGLPLLGCDVVAIYDCIPELFPDNANTLKSKLNRLLYMKRVAVNLRKSKCIFTDSESAKNDLIKFYKFDTKKIHVLPCGWQHVEKISSDDKILTKLELEPKEYFFSLGSRYIHKNFKWIVEAARQNPKYKFVSSGSNKLSTSDSALNDEMPNNLIFAGYLSDEEVKTLMANCRAFIQPSLYEGFGIPPMEAMSVGANCIVSNVSSLPEVYKKSAWYINPEIYQGINMDKIMQDVKEDNSVILNSYSWKESARILWDYLKSI